MARHAVLLLDGSWCSAPRHLPNSSARYSCERAIKFAERRVSIHDCEVSGSRLRAIHDEINAQIR